MSSLKLEIEGSMDVHSGGSGEEGSSEGKAPSEFLAECLSASLRRRYGAALRYCRLILRHEPRHRAARALLPTLRTRAAAAAAATLLANDTTHQEKVGDSSASATDDSSHSTDGAERSGSESGRLEQSHSESRSEDAASDCVSELELESELEDELLEDLDTYTSTGASSLQEVTDSSGGGGEDCDDNGNCTSSDFRNDNANPGDTALRPLIRSQECHGDSRPIALDNDRITILDYQLRKSCAH